MSIYICQKSIQMLRRLIFLFLGFPLWLAAQPEQEFLHHFSGPGTQSLSDLCTDLNGNVWSAFYAPDGLQLRDSSDQLIGMGQGGLICKHDPWGKLLQSIHIDGNRYRPFSLKVDGQQNVYVVGVQNDSATIYDPKHPNGTYSGLEDEITLVKYDSQGNMLWLDVFENSVQSGQGTGYFPKLALQGDSIVFLSIQYPNHGFDADPSSNINQPPAGTDSLGYNSAILKLDAQGNLIRYWAWPEIVGGIRDLALDHSGTLYSLISFQGYFDLDPDSNSTAMVNALQYTAQSYNTGSALLSIDANQGQLKWHRSFLGSQSIFSLCLEFDPKRNWIWLGGSQLNDFYTNDIPNYYHHDYGSHLLAYNTFGIRRWEGFTSSNNNGSRIEDIAVNANGDIAISGQLRGGGDLNPSLIQDTIIPGNSHLEEAYILKLDSMFQMEWARLLGDNDDYQNANRIVASGSSGYFVGLHSLNYSNSPFNFSFNQIPTENFSDPGESASILGIRECLPADTSLLYIDGTLYAQDSSASIYYWIDCFADTILQSGPQAHFTPQRRSWVKMRIQKDYCYYESECISLNDVSLSEDGIESIKLYPNPGKGERTVYNPENENLVAKLYTSNGQFLSSYVLKPGSNKIDFQLKPGIYILRIQDRYNTSFKIICP